MQLAIFLGSMKLDRRQASHRSAFLRALTLQSAHKLLSATQATTNYAG